MNETLLARFRSANIVQRKSEDTCLLLKNAGNGSFKEKNFETSSNVYTLSLLFAPPYCKHENKSTNSVELEDYTLGVLYGNRSAVFFRLKKYEQCIKDILRALANGPHDPSRYTKLMTRLAWSYWHLKKVHECNTTVKLLLDESGDTKSAREVRVLQHLIHKAKQSHICQMNTSDHQTTNQEDPKDVLKNVNINFEKTKGRFIRANRYMTATETILHEKAFCFVINSKFYKTHCNFCLKECKATGVPCHGCINTIYCNEACRKNAWVKYHWLECCMWPVLGKVEAFARMAIRMLLYGAYEHFSAQQDEQKLRVSGHTCSSIAIQIKNTCAPSKANATAKHKKKQLFSSPTSITGLNPADNKYYGNYWSVFCLQTHLHDHTKATISSCEDVAYLLATTLERCVFEDSLSDHVPKHISNIESIVNQVFSGLSFPPLHDDQTFEIEEFRERVGKISAELGANISSKKAKQQNHSFSRDLPKNSQDVLAYLIRHHMLQLYTNSQAIIQVMAETDSDKDVETISQQRLALAVFPNCSLLNHSCDANTFVHFVGDTLSVKLIRSVNEGEEITHSYGPCVTRYSYKDRQKVLKDQYFFKCECKSCLRHKTASADEQASMDQLTAFKCNSCGGPVKIMECTRDTKSIWGKCIDVSCLKLHNLTEVQNLYIQTMQEVNSQTFRIIKGNLDSALEVLTRALKTMETILYRNHQTIGALHDQLAFCYSFKQDTPSAIEHIIKSSKIVSLKFGSKSIEYGREIFKLSSMYFKMSQFFLAHKYLAIASPILLKLLPPESEEKLKVESMLKCLECMDLQLKVAK